MFRPVCHSSEQPLNTVGETSCGPRRRKSCYNYPCWEEPVGHHGGLDSRLHYYEEIDDVFQKQFLQAVLFSGGRSDSSISSEASALLQGFGMQWHHFLTTDSWNLPCSGPYILLDGYLHDPFRLYSDENHAFFSSTR